MATTVKKKSVSGNEKRGTSISSSSSPSTSTIRKLSRLSTPTSSGDHERPTTPSDTKPIPNYLKPTISSILSTADGAAQLTLKPAFNRMRSFDKAPQSSQAQKPVRGSSGGIKTTRSSSFSSSSSSSSRNALKGGKLSESNLAKPKDIKRSSLPCKTTKKEPKSVVLEPNVVVIEDLDMVNIDDHEVQTLPDISEMPERDTELGDPTNLDQQAEVDQEHHKKLKPINEEDHEVHKQESTTPPPPSSPVKDGELYNHDHENSTGTIQLGERSTEQEIVITTQEKESHHVEEENDQNHKAHDEKHLHEEHQSEEQIQVEQGTEEQDGLDREAGPTQKLPEQQPQQQQQMLEEKTEIANINEETPTNSSNDTTSVSASIEEKSKEKQTEEKNEEQETAPTPTPTPTPTTTPTPTPTPVVVKRSTGGGNKKESQQAYNDVIEETSKKLMGSARKNKVLALAGAFETVISLQDSSPSKH